MEDASSLEWLAEARPSGPAYGVYSLMPIGTRKRVEEIFGWMKTVGGFRRTRYQGLDRTRPGGYLVATAYNLVRMAKLVLKEVEEGLLMAQGGKGPMARAA